MVKLTIDGRELEAEEGAMLLDVARENNIYIPALCSNEGLTPYGACRLCLVEVEARGGKRVVASCLYPVREGLVAETNTEKVKGSRRAVMELLLARCPNNKVIKDLAKRLGVEETPYKLEDNDCILCGLCARACQEVVGVSAISLVNRGVGREVAAPFYEPSEACIGCGSCAYVCPVDAISFEDSGDTRTVTLPTGKWEFKLKKCKVCGAYWIPEKQLDYIAKKAGLKPEDLDICPDCRE